MKAKVKLVRFGFLMVMFLTIATLMWAMPTSAASETKYNISDAVKLQKYLTCQITTLTVEEAKVLDVDKNKKLSAVDLTLMKRILIYGEPQQQETTTTQTETTTTTTETTTTQTETTTETTVSTIDQEFPPKRETITNQNGDVIPEDIYNTLVEYAEKYKVEKYSIVWTESKVTEDSLFVIDKSDEAEVKCKGAFWITTGEKFYQTHKKLFEKDPTFTEQDYNAVKEWPYICWRQCDEEYVKKYPDNMLYSFTIVGEEADIKFFYGQQDGSNYGEWALIPEKEDEKPTTSRDEVTTPNGDIIPEVTYNTFVEFAKENNISKYKIKWTGGEMPYNSVIVLGNKSSTNYVCEGAFWISRGTDFYEMTKDYLDPEEDAEEIDDLQNYEYVAWRHCDDAFMEKYPYNELSYFFEGGTDIRYFKWTQYEDTVNWVLIPM